MKSRIRSRWYRANEKPLESSQETSTQQAPFGEIDLSQQDSIKDDLSNVKPLADSDRKRGYNSHRKNHDRAPRPNRDNRNRRQDNHKDKQAKEQGSKGERQNQTHRKRRSKHKKDHRNEDGKNYSGQTKRRKNPNKDQQRNPKSKNLHAKDKPTEPKSGLGKFISKIFGG